MNFVFLEQEYHGYLEFPYDEIDLALYLHDLLTREQQLDTVTEILNLEDDGAQFSLKIDERQSEPRKIIQPRNASPSEFIELDCAKLIPKKRPMINS